MSRRLYRPGPRITSLAELIAVCQAGTPVYLFGVNHAPRAWAFVQNLQLRVLINAVARGVPMATKVWLP